MFFGMSSMGNYGQYYLVEEFHQTLNNDIVSLIRLTKYLFYSQEVRILFSGT